MGQAQDPPSWVIIGGMKSSTGPIAVGSHAPDFELRHTFEESIRLSEMLEKGPVVVLFYVFDFGDI